MHYCSTLIAVRDMACSLEFYRTVLGLTVERDFGANKTLTGGIVLQTAETWKDFIAGRPVAYGGNAGELYFEEDAFDDFAERLGGLDVDYVHPVLEHPWGQRVVRFFDPDRNIIEVGENLAAVCRRFLDSGMTVCETAARMDVPEDYVRACQAQK